MQYFTNHITHVPDRVGPGQPRVGSGRAKSETLALDPMRAGPGHKNTGPALGPTRASPALGQCKTVIYRYNQIDVLLMSFIPFWVRVLCRAT